MIHPLGKVEMFCIFANLFNIWLRRRHLDSLIWSPHRLGFDKGSSRHLKTLLPNPEEEDEKTYSTKFSLQDLAEPQKPPMDRRQTNITHFDFLHSAHHGI